METARKMEMGRKDGDAKEDEKCVTPDSLLTFRSSMTTSTLIFFLRHEEPLTTNTHFEILVGI
jgi:hypothetical protein